MSSFAHLLSIGARGARWFEGTAHSPSPRCDLPPARWTVQLGMRSEAPRRLARTAGICAGSVDGHESPRSAIRRCQEVVTRLAAGVPPGQKTPSTRSVESPSFSRQCFVPGGR